MVASVLCGAEGGTDVSGDGPVVCIGVAEDENEVPDMVSLERRNGGSRCGRHDLRESGYLYGRCIRKKGSCVENVDVVTRTACMLKAKRRKPERIKGGGKSVISIHYCFVVSPRRGYIQSTPGPTNLSSADHTNRNTKEIHEIIRRGTQLLLGQTQEEKEQGRRADSRERQPSRRFHPGSISGEISQVHR